MNGDIEYQLFEDITTDECYEEDCPYLECTNDPYGTGDHHYNTYECVGNTEVCPLLADKVQNYIEAQYEGEDDE